MDSEKPKAKPDKTLRYMLALVVIMIVAGIFAWFFGQKDKKPIENSQSDNRSASSSDSPQNKDLEQLAAQSMDVERQADIKVLYTELDKYFNTHGMYPTLAQLNDAKWRVANVPGINEPSLKDPEGTQAVLVGTQTEGAYAYAVTPTGCDNAAKGKCTAYTLTAIMESSQAYTKKSFGT